MKINIECDSLTVNNTFSLEENGLIALLEKYNNHGVVEFADVVGSNDLKAAAGVLKKLVKRNVFNINETNENDSLVINIINDSSKKELKLVNISPNQKIHLCYQLNEAKVKSIQARSNDSKSFKLNLVNICFENYTERKLPITEVNSQEDFLKFMYSITPFETILSHGKKLTRRDFDQVFELLVNYDFDLAVINFAIDYAINTSVYHNLSYDFVIVLLDSWKKHKITDVNGAIELITLQKQAGISKGSKYVAPSYDEPVMAATDQVSIKNLFAEDDSFE
ncbi:DnaD domain protein [Mollicutes bacterium LVI A0039]|nr:DnaD domain protein [Mollicutes bacterium LVI A0039]